jgi:hypothetical protein
VEPYPDLRAFEVADHAAALRRDARHPVAGTRTRRPRQRVGRLLIQAGLRLAPDARPALVR